MVSVVDVHSTTSGHPTPERQDKDRYHDYKCLPLHVVDVHSHLFFWSTHTRWAGQGQLSWLLVFTFTCGGCPLTPLLLVNPHQMSRTKTAMILIITVYLHMCGCPLTPLLLVNPHQISRTRTVIMIISVYLYMWWMSTHTSSSGHPTPVLQGKDGYHAGSH